MELILTEESVVRERAVPEEGDEDDASKDDGTFLFHSFRQFPWPNPFNFIPHEREHNEAYKKGSEVVVQIHHAGNPADGNHVRAVHTQKDEQEEKVVEAFFRCKEEVRCEESNGKDDSGQCKPPSRRICLQVEILVILPVRGIPAIVDGACSYWPEECRTSILIGLTEV